MSKLNFPLVLFVPYSNGNATVIVEFFNVVSVHGKASLNISWRFNTPETANDVDPLDRQKIETYIARYVMERVI
jgi:hypothetical protein